MCSTLTEIARFGVKQKSATEDVVRRQNLIDGFGEAFHVDGVRKFEQAADVHHCGFRFVEVRVDQPALNGAQRIKFFRRETFHKNSSLHDDDQLVLVAADHVIFFADVERVKFFERIEGLAVFAEDQSHRILTRNQRDLHSNNSCAG